MQTNGCESNANKANGLRLLLHFRENALGMDTNGLQMAYEHYDCLTNALLIPSDLNANIAILAVGCCFGSQNGIYTTIPFLPCYISSASMAEA